jgi:DNA-binding PucR family transcriptional regulator
MKCFILIKTNGFTREIANLLDKFYLAPQINIESDLITCCYDQEKNSNDAIFEALCNTLYEDFNIGPAFRGFAIKQAHEIEVIKKAFLRICHSDSKYKTYYSKDILDNDYQKVKELYKDKLHDFKDVIEAMFKADLVITQAAKISYLHRNTVINKISQLKQYSGLDLQNFYDAMRVFMILHDSADKKNSKD